MPSDTEGKTEIALIERAFLGYGYFHIFLNDKTGEKVPVETTEQDYVLLGEVEGSDSNPVLDGHTWKQSVGNAMKVDSPTGFLRDKEYTIIDQKAHVSIETKLGSGMAVAKTEIVADTIKIDTEKLADATAEAEVINP